MASAARKDVCTKLHTVLKKHYPAAPKSSRTQVVEELVYATLLRNAGPVLSESLFTLLSNRDNFVDWNEMRVTSVRELSSFLKGHPTAVATATRIKQILQWLFDHRYTFDCEDYRKKTLAEAEEFLAEMGGTSPFVVQQMAQTVLGAHAAPLDEASTAVLILLGALTPADAEKGKSAEQIKAAVPKNKCAEFTQLLQQAGADFRGHRTPALMKAFASVASDAASRLSQTEAFLRESMEKASEAPAPIKPPPPVFPPRDGIPVPAGIGGDLDLIDGIVAPPELSDAASVDAALAANLRKLQKPGTPPAKAADRNSHPAGEKNSHGHEPPFIVPPSDKAAEVEKLPPADKEVVKEKPARNASKGAGASPIPSSPFPVPDLPQKSTTRKRAPVDHDALDAAPPAAPPAKEAAHGPAKEAAHGKESPAKDSHAKGAGKEHPAKEASGKEHAAKESHGKESHGKGAAAKPAGAKEGHGKESAKDAPPPKSGKEGSKKKEPAAEADAPRPESKGGGKGVLKNLVAEKTGRARPPKAEEPPPPPPAEEEEKPRKRRPK